MTNEQFAVIFLVLANAWWMVASLCFAIRPKSYVGLCTILGWVCIGIAISAGLDL